MLTYFKNVLLLPIVCIDVEIKYAWLIDWLIDVFIYKLYKFVAWSFFTPIIETEGLWLQAIKDGAKSEVLHRP